MKDSGGYGPGKGGQVMIILLWPRLEVSWYLHGTETELILEASGALRRTKHGPNGPLKWEGDVGPG